MGGSKPPRADNNFLLLIACVGLLSLSQLAQPGLLLAASSVARGQSQQQGQDDEVTITIRPDGFTPAQLVRRAGSFFLLVDNRTEVEDIILRLDREDGTHIRDIRVPPNAMDWRETVELPAGRFTLTETSHPDWVCHIVTQ